MTPAPDVFLPVLAIAAVAVLIVLIAWARLHAFIALLIVSAGMGLAAGMPPAAIMTAFQDGVGATLGFIAIVIALGAVLGALVAESGAAAVVAKQVTSSVPDAWLPWAVALLGFFVGLPVFFSVGLVLLVPIVVGLAIASGRSLPSLALPLVAGLSASHGLVAPHPGPLVAIERLGADPGRSILYAIAAGIPAMLVAGPLYVRLASLASLPSSASLAGRPEALRHTSSPSSPGRPEGLRYTSSPSSPSLASSAPLPFWMAAGLVLLPIVLMLAASLADGFVPKATSLRWWIDFFGSPVVAMTLATLVAYRVCRTSTGADRTRLAALTNGSLLPLASVLLVVGAGGGFGRVLDRAGVGQAIVGAVSGWHLSPLVFAWLVAALLRIAVGSATVAVTTAASIVAPLVVARPDVSRELVVVALGAGSLIASHVNDGGFWLVKEYLGLSVPDTLRSWTVLETIISVVALAVVLALAAAGL